MIRNFIRGLLLAAFLAMGVASTTVPVQAAGISAEFAPEYDCLNKRQIARFLDREGFKLLRVLDREHGHAEVLVRHYESGERLRLTVRICGGKPDIVDKAPVESPDKEESKKYGCVTEAEVFKFLKANDVKPERVISFKKPEPLVVRGVYYKDDKRYDYTIRGLCDKLYITDVRPSEVK